MIMIYRNGFTVAQGLLKRSGAYRKWSHKHAVKWRLYGQHELMGFNSVLNCAFFKGVNTN